HHRHHGPQRHLQHDLLSASTTPSRGPAHLPRPHPRVPAQVRARPDRGTLASCVNIPFDVAKSRIQGPQPVKGEVMYRGTIRTIRMVYADEGFRALYKGLLPKILRLGPGGAIMLLVYEYVYNHLQEKILSSGPSPSAQASWAPSSSRTPRGPSSTGSPERMHLNDLENYIPFFILGSLYVTTGTD
ncbi:unnamed protein product, partial [Sphagnum tenellum]